MAIEPVPALATGTLLEDRYEVLDVLGRGGMAVVYRVLDHRLDRRVAIKVLDRHHEADAGSAFREDRLTARLAHPHIVGIYDSGVTPDGRPYLVMELIDGEPVSRQAPLPLERALAVAAEVTAAVAYAHRQGVVHCDIKPQNVLVDAFGRARLTDFGVASADAAPVGEVVYGSAVYIAPERLRGVATNSAVDIYALGALLYFMIAGQPPYSGSTSAEVIEQVRSGPPAPLAAVVPTTPPAVDAIVRRAMEPSPADRYLSADDLLDAIAAIRHSATERTGVLPVEAASSGLLNARDRQEAGVAGAAEPTAALPAAPRAAPPRATNRRLGHWPAPVLTGFLVLVVLVAGLIWGMSALRGGAETGEATVAVPALDGLTLNEAYQRLLDSGLIPGEVDIAPGPGEPANVVVHQEPPAGNTVQPGTRVNLVIRTAESED